MSVMSMLLGGADTDIGIGLLPPALPNARNGESIALSGDTTVKPLTCIVGAPGYLDGAVHVYHKNGATYDFVTTILSPAPDIDFGASVALNQDGTVLAIGAPDDQGDGRVHMYIWVSNRYQPEAQGILDPNIAGLGPGPGGRTGESVVLSKVGDSLMASAPHANTDDRGWAYSWYNIALRWELVPQRIGELPPAQANGHCSESMDMAADGLTTILMQPGNGYIRIFERSTIPASFVEVFTLQVATIGGLNGVAMEDGGLVAFLTDPPAGASTGGVRSFVRNGTWSPVAFVAAPVTAGSTFGTVIVARNNDFFVGEFSANLVHEFDYTNVGAMTFIGSFGAGDNSNGQQYGHSLSLVFPGGIGTLGVGEPNRFRLGFSGAGNAYTEFI